MTKYDNINKLLKNLEQKNESSVAAAVSLCRVFTRLMVSGDMIRKQGAAEDVVKRLKELYSEYKSGLLTLLGEESIAPTALTLRPIFSLSCLPCSVDS